MRYFFLVSIFFLLSVLSCKQKPVELSDLRWILGTWQIEGKPLFEEWSRANAHLYRGKGYEARKNDTLVTETIEIAQIGEEIFYIPTVQDQNDGKAVMFKLISKDPEFLIFENKTHDFPQRIVYRKNGKTKIDASIEGQGKNGYSKIGFPYVRISD